MPSLDVGLAELFRRDLLASWIGMTVQSSAYHQASMIGRVADQVDRISPMLSISIRAAPASESIDFRIRGTL
jgi:hypothetical protein